MGSDGSADLGYVLQVAESIGKNMDHHLIVVNKSTVPVGTADKVRLTIQKELDSRHSKLTFSVVSNRFLHHMIRYLVGTMIAVSEDRISKKSFNFLLANPRKNVRIFKAPPQGLILNRIDYE